MSAKGGPDIVTDGLVLALDAANIKSFRGEPTTNLLLYTRNLNGARGQDIAVVHQTHHSTPTIL